MEYRGVLAETHCRVLTVWMPLSDTNIFLFTDLKTNSSFSPTFFSSLRANMLTLSALFFSSFSSPSCRLLTLSVFGSPAVSPELPPRYLLGQGQRPNTITHVCWYRNQNLSLTDYLRMNQVLEPRAVMEPYGGGALSDMIAFIL